MSPLRTLLTGIVDYAGLFPPAKLEMRPTVENYRAYLESEHNWMLGRLIVPVSRLDEFEQAARTFLPQDPDDPTPWRISALVPPPNQKDPWESFQRIDDFNEAHSELENGLAEIDTIEIKTDTVAQIDEVLELLPEEERAFFEIPIDEDPRGLIAAIAGTGSAAKVRTGNVVPEGFPSAPDLARFICACAAADVPFKATAGLHHPIRAEHALTYEPNAPCGVMFGFFNVFLASAFAFAEGCTSAALTEILEEQSANAFIFDPGGVKYRQNHLTNAQIAASREHFALSFGSCSFEEPVEDLKGLRLL